jgi:hypothetical protein
MALTIVLISLNSAISYVYKMDRKHKDRREMVVTQHLLGGISGNARN